MALRRVNITRSTNIGDSSGLENNAYVRKVWRTPWNFTLFEFYDPIYEMLDNPSSKLSDVTEWSAETRSYMNQLVDAERKILSPLYRWRPRHWQGNKLGLFLRTAIYRILDHRTLSLPFIGYSDAWELARTIRICGRVRQVSDLNLLEQTFDEWAKWLVGIGQNPKPAGVNFKHNDFHVLCEFPESCGDACMALYTALIGTPVEAVGFFLPDQSDLLYLEIGGSRKILAHV